MNSDVIRRTIVTTVAMVASIAGAWAGGQETTEVYIPIGKSPGVSGVSSIVGTVTEVDYDAKSLVVTTDGSPRSIDMDDETDYYLDRSDSNEPSTKGDVRDCQVGRTVEVKFAEDGKADWIKIDAG